MSTDVVYFDFSKASDSVSNDLLLGKLKEFYSIDGRLLKFFLNYLDGRGQRVVLDVVSSSFKPVLSGVQQGYILDPILFVLFIYDIPNGLSSNTIIALYADDTKIWRSIKSGFDISELKKETFASSDGKNQKTTKSGINYEFYSK